MKYITHILLMCFTLLVLPGCKKFLDEKPTSSSIEPKTLKDLQALLENYAILNRTGVAAAEVSADDYYITNQDYSVLTNELKRTYTWEKSNLFAKGANDWSLAYDRVFIANVVLDNIDKVEKNASNAADWEDVKAQALFVRSYAFLEVAVTWTLAYEASTAVSGLGIPLRLRSDITEKISRSSLEQTYIQIVNDLTQAAALAKKTPLHPIKPAKAAVYALLARTYLTMRDYDNCLKNADLCLQIKKDLLDFNVNPPLNLNATFPFGSSALIYNNPEIIYVSRFSPPVILNNARAKIDSTLYQSYETNDLRKQVYFKNNNNKTFGFKGSLDGSQFLFNGIAVDEVYLMRAECYARKGMLTAAMADLNTLMVKRWNKNVAYPTFTAANAAEALTIILKERRKELLMRGLRWMDIKRLNAEGANITLKRVINGQVYTLAPNDSRYALAIPESIVDISGVPQNPR